MDKPDTPTFSLDSVRHIWDAILDEVTDWILPDGAFEIEFEEDDGL